MTDTTEAAEEKNFEILEEKTVQTMDFILRGLELGKFDETAKKVEFLGKLSGDKSPKYIAKLLSRISELETKTRFQASTIDNLDYKITQLEINKTTMETQITTLETSMNTVAKAIRQLFEPKPLRDSYDFSEINNFCNSNNATSY